MRKKKKTLSVPFVLMGMLFCICLVTSNLLETKIFRVCGSVTLTCGFIVFPVSYILNDCIAEVWGFRKARFIIWLGFAMDFFVVLLGGLACLLPAVPEGGDAAFREVFGFAPQIVAASFTAFIVGSLLNAWVMSAMKVADKGKGSFSLRFSFRAILSTVVGEGADSLIFFPLAFFLLPSVFEGGPKVSGALLISLMVTQVVAKTLYEIIVLPLTIRVVKYVKRIEGVDVYDEHISYNPLKITDI